MHIVLLKFALLSFTPVSYTTPWVNPDSGITYKTKGHSARGRMPWRTESLSNGLPEVIKKGSI